MIKISASPRLSSMELLRILSMFAILVLHANLNALPYPTAENVSDAPFPTFVRLFFGAFTFGSVNVFVLISGWFGIRPRLKGLAALLFQCLFFSIGVYLVCLAFGLTSISLRGVADCFFFTPDGYWFVKAYLMLYLFAPVLNAFIERVPRATFRNLLIGCFAFQTLYSGIAPGSVDAANFFMRGYSPLSFFLLYLLARYARLYRPRFAAFSRRTDLLAFFAITLLLAAHAFLALRFGIRAPFVLLKYTSPAIELSSLAILLYFSKLNFQSRAINWVASSCFSVYLFHCNNDVVAGYFLSTCRTLFEDYSGAAYLSLLFVFLAAVFAVSVLLDRLRLLCWHAVEFVRNRTINC